MKLVKDRYRITYMWNLKSDTNEFIYKMEIESQTQKTNMVTKGDSGSWGEINQKFGVNMYRLLHIKQADNEDLLYSTGELYSISCNNL